WVLCVAPRLRPVARVSELLVRADLEGLGERLAKPVALVHELLDARKPLPEAQERGRLHEGQVHGVVLDREALRAGRLIVEGQQEAIERLVVRGGDREERDLAANVRALVVGLERDLDGRPERAARGEA